MIEAFNPAAQIFLSGMNNIQARLSRSQTQLTTGLQINTASDDPNALGDLYEVRSSLAQANQIDSNLGLVSTEVNTSEGAVSNAVTLLDNVTTLATQAEPTTISAATRTQISQQVGSDLQEMVALANTNVGNRYVFSGDSDQTEPYTVDLTQTNPVSAYQGTAATRQVQSPDGSTFPVSITAQQIFDSSDPTTSVFGAITSLYTALQNNDQAGIDTAITNLQSTSTYLNTQLAFYGTVQDRVASATTFGATLTTQLQTEQSGIEDANAAQAITNMTMATTDEQAALAAEKEIPQTTLFDLLG
jgi:flagellar hook-associated protein 3 FlgL